LLARKLICRCQGVEWLSDDVVFQERFDDCGWACVEMTLCCLERRGELDKKPVRFCAEALTLLQIAELFKDLQLEAVGMHFSSLDELRELLLQHSKIHPLIVLRGSCIPYGQGPLDHLVLLVDCTEKYAELKDPALGHVRLSKERLSKKWTGKALLVCSRATAEVLRVRR